MPPNGPTIGRPSTDMGRRPHHSEIGRALPSPGKQVRPERVSCSSRGLRSTRFSPENSIVPAKRTNVYMGVQKTELS